MNNWSFFCFKIININKVSAEDISTFLFNEELGAIIQVASDDLGYVSRIIQEKLGDTCLTEIGQPISDHTITILNENKVVLSETRTQLQEYWSQTSYKIQSLRDNPKCAKEEFNKIADNNDPGISPIINFDIPTTLNIKKTKPKIAILREQGVNGHNEMAAAFYYAGFEAHDVHMSDIARGKRNLNEFQALAACGGFSFGDVLGAGQGWAKSILFNQFTRDQFQEFFYKDNTLTLGVCNGCQMLSCIKELIPGTKLWPDFIKNESEQFEARFLSVSIEKNNSPFFDGMEGSVLPVAVAHGEGRVLFQNNKQLNDALNTKIISPNFNLKYNLSNADLSKNILSLIIKIIPQEHLWVRLAMG